MPPNHLEEADLKVGPKRTLKRLIFQNQKKCKVEVRSRSASELTPAAEIANRLSGHRNLGTFLIQSSEYSEKRISSDVVCDGRQLTVTRH